MKNLLLTILPAALILVPLCIVAFPALWLNRLKAKGKRSPLSRDLLRNPGESLRQQISDVSTDIAAYLLVVAVMPLAGYAACITQLHFLTVHNPVISIAINGLFVGTAVIYVFTKLAKSLAHRINLRLGLDAELAIGQELNQLMLSGYRVYHDFLAEGFNIDHIVIGPNGVFAVETKGRAKPKDTTDRRNWTVTYDGANLVFPNWTEQEYLLQARRQAQWLATWLSSAVGEPVAVRPALAITGWMIEQKKPCDVILFSGKNPPLPKISCDKPLSAEMIQRVAHQIEQACRDVEPLAYSKH